MDCEIGATAPLSQLKGYTFIEARERLDNMVENVRDNGGEAAQLDVLKNVTRAAIKRHLDWVEIWATESDTPRAADAQYVCIA